MMPTDLSGLIREADILIDEARRVQHFPGKGIFVSAERLAKIEERITVLEWVKKRLQGEKEPMP